MKIKSSILAILIMALLMSNVSAKTGGGTDIDPPVRSGETWTVLSYMNGEGDLEKFIVEDLMEMERVGSSENVNIVVQIDLGTNQYYSSPYATWTDTRRYLVEYHPEDGIGSTRLDDPPLGEIDMDDPDSLKDFLSWGLSNYPADHYMIALEGHSGGPARGLMEDGSSSLGEPYTMDVGDMGVAIRDSIDSTLGEPVDIISFDVCWMGMAETATEIMDHSDYMVGSFDEIPGAGWPYDRCLPQILDQPSLPIPDRLGLAVDEYMDHYNPDGAESYASLSVIDLQHFKEDLLPGISYLAEEMFYSAYSHRDAYDSILALVDKPRLRNDNVWDRYVDLYQMAELISIDDRFPPRVRDAADMIMTSEELTVLHSRGGTNHAASSRLFGIYYPTIRNDQKRYSPLMMSELTAWDEYAAMVVEELELTGRGINWTYPDPERVVFEMRTTTPGLVSEVSLDVMLDGTPNSFTLTGQGGYYKKTLQTGGASTISYRYSVKGLYSNKITLPPDGYSTIRISEESDPPEIWHDHTDSVTISASGGGLSFLVRDDTGIEMSQQEGIARLEYREVGSSSWYSIPLALIDHDPFRGWMTYRGLPSGISPGAEMEYHMLVSDVYGNLARYPASGELKATMSEGKRFYMDAYRSDISLHSGLVNLFSRTGMSLVVGSQSTIPDLSGFKGYLLIKPAMPLSEKESDDLMRFHEEGGELFIIIDPLDGEQEVNARYLLENLGVNMSSQGEVNGFYPSDPDSDLSDNLPHIAGSSHGSIEIPDNMKAVYYISPPDVALATGRTGYGKAIISIPDIFFDERMDLNANRFLGEMVVTFLHENEPPVVVYNVNPDGVVVPGERIIVDMSDSFDPDGHLVSYSVSISDNTHLEGPDAVFVHEFTEPGQYTLLLTVFDAEGEQSSISHSLKVNRPPSLEYGISDRTINSGETVIFDYKGSDPDGDDIYVLWDFGDGFKVQGKTVSHEYNRKGTFTYTLTVRDSNSIEVNRTGIINVLNSDPVAVIDTESIRVNSIPGNFTGPSMVTLVVKEGDVIYLPGDLSRDEDSEDVLNLTWTMGDGNTYYGLHAIHRYFRSGLFEVKLTVSDGFGGISNTTLLISVENRPPVAVFIVSEERGGKLSFNATMSIDDPWDMETLIYKWDLGNGDRRTTYEPLMEYRYTFGGTYNVTLTVMDGDGAFDVYSREVKASGMTFRDTMLISLVVLLVLGVVGVVSILMLKNRLNANDQGLMDLFKKRKYPPDEKNNGGFSRPRKEGTGTQDRHHSGRERGFHRPSKVSSFDQHYNDG